MPEAFDPLRYIASYPDLIAAFGTNAAAGRQHWEQIGQAEGRDPFLFDPFVYGATHADLTAAFGADSDALSRHYILNGFNEHRATSGFDALRYGASNPDVADYYGLDENGLAGHWLRYGRDEGRSIDSFDALQYAASNIDLARHFRDNVEGLTEHYILYGIDEGRATSGFDALRYGASNHDLTRFFGFDEEALLRHWVRNGVDEQRLTTFFDPREYLAVNPDLVRAGYDTSAEALQYFLSGGYNDSRLHSGFDEVGYWLTYPDLAAAGLDPDEALDHWIRSGIAEGRVGDAYFGRDQAAHIPRGGQSLQGTDRDWYSIDLTQGLPIGIFADAETAALDVDLYLYDSNGALVASDLDLTPGGTARINYLPSVSGLYYIVVRSGNYETGNFYIDTGSSQPDRIVAFTNNQLGPGVVVDGTATGFDEVSLFTNASLANPDFTGFQLIAVEQFTITNAAARPITLDMSGSTGQRLLVLKTYADVTFHDVTNLAALKLENLGDPNKDVTVRYRNSLLTGADTTAFLILSSASIDDLTLGGVTGGGIERLVVAIQGQSNAGAIDTLIADIGELMIVGGGILFKVDDALSTTIRTITNALSHGDVDVDFSNNDGAGQGVTYLGSNAAGYVGKNIVLAGDASDTITTFGGIDTITTGAGSDTVSTGAGLDRIIVGAFLDSSDDIDGGADGAVIVVSGRSYADLDFAGLVNVNAVEVSDTSSLIVGETARGAGINRVIASSSGANNISAAGYAGNIVIDASGGGSDNVITGGGNDTGIAGIGSQNFILGGGDDILLVSGTEWGIGDSADGGSGFDRFRLDTSVAEASAVVDLGTVTGFESFESIANGGVVGAFTFTGGSSAAAVPIEIMANNPLTTTLGTGLTDADFAFTLRTSTFGGTLVKANVGVANLIDYIGGTGVDKLVVNTADLVSTLTMNGGQGSDVLAISGGTLTDAGFARLQSVENLTATGVPLIATLGAQAMAAGLAQVSIVDGGGDLVVGAGFTSSLVVSLSRSGNDPFAVHPTDRVDASASAAAIAFVTDSGAMQAGDVLIGGMSSNDVLNLAYRVLNNPLGPAPPFPAMSLEGVTGVETIRIDVTAGGVIRPKNFGPVIIDATADDLDGVGFLRVEVTGVRLSSNLLDAPIAAGSATADLYVTGSANVTAGSGNDRILLGPQGTTIAGTAKGGAGDDRIAGQGGADTINGEAGLDRIVGGLGGDALVGGADADNFLYTRMADSRGTARDTISDFISGSDVIDVRALDDGGQFAGDTIAFAGNAANLAAAQALLTAGDDTLDAVFQQDQRILWFDNGDGVLDASDLQIILTGVSALAAADVLAGAMVQPQPDFLDTFFA